MIDEPASAPVSSGPVCPWCSEPLLAADIEHCPSCGAAMSAEQEPVIPGVTTVEPEILARQARALKPRRSGLMGLFVRDDEKPNIQQPTEAELPALARPSLEVRREMLRMELEVAGVLPAEAGGDEAAGPGGAADPAETAGGHDSASVPLPEPAPELAPAGTLQPAAPQSAAGDEPPAS